MQNNERQRGKRNVEPHNEEN